MNLVSSHITQEEKMQRDNQILIDIENEHDRLGTSMREKFKSLSALSPLRCIYKVPKRLREVNEKAYTPQVVSIGPLHHGEPHLLAMEEHKLRYVQDLLLRNKVNLESCIKKVRDQVVKLRSCYAENIRPTGDEFVELVLVDALFLIELLLRDNSEDLRSEYDDYIFSKPLMHADIWSDLVMLENQLPFFILKNLWEVVGSPRPLLLHAYDSFWNQIHGQKANPQTLLMLYNSSLKVKHFVDVIRHFYQPTGTKSGSYTRNISRATQLHQEGVKFGVKETNSLLDIHFEDESLKIPKLVIDDYTETRIRNLVAYEQCHGLEGYIGDYVIFMDCLVNTPQDVELLEKRDILNNLLGDSKKVSTLINNLGNGVLWDSDNFYFGEICDGLNEHCKKRWPKWKLILRKNYLNTPWTIISVGAAIILLVFTIAQTVSSIISVV